MSSPLQAPEREVNLSDLTDVMLPVIDLSRWVEWNWMKPPKTCNFWHFGVMGAVVLVARLIMVQGGVARLLDVGSRLSSWWLGYLDRFLKMLRPRTRRFAYLPTTCRIVIPFWLGGACSILLKASPMPLTYQITWKCQTNKLPKFVTDGVLGSRIAATVFDQSSVWMILLYHIVCISIRQNTLHYILSMDTTHNAYGYLYVSCFLLSPLAASTVNLFERGGQEDSPIDLRHVILGPKGKQRIALLFRNPQTNFQILKNC